MSIVQLFVVATLSLSLSLSLASPAHAAAASTHSHVDLAAPVVRLSRRTASNATDPAIFAGEARIAKIPRSRRHLDERATPGNPKGASFYSALVAIGASYTDNAHARSDKHASSLRQYYPYDEYDGKYTNGKVAVEYMVDPSISPSLKRQRGKHLVLQDFAYGGSVIQNSLAGTGSSSPAAVDQISTYLSELESGSFDPGNGRVLHYFNSGINPVAQIWNNAMGSGFSASAKANAVSAISKNVAAYAESIQSIARDKTARSKLAGIDFVLVGIPPLEIVPTFGWQVSSSVSKSDALDFLKQLSQQFNSELEKFAKSLGTQNRRSRVFWYDLADLWYSINASPSSFGLSASPITKACYNSSTGGVCSDPGKYLYWDTLHPTTVVHKIMAQKINALVLGMTRS
ncbi:hypothetical protein JCM10212_001256 [Sporobolomyces blumeae]